LCFCGRQKGFLFDPMFYSSLSNQALQRLSWKANVNNYVSGSVNHHVNITSAARQQCR
jgi:hypothetical protein